MDAANAVEREKTSYLLLLIVVLFSGILQAYWVYDGKAEERRSEREKNRSKEKRAETWKKYYAEHGAEIREKRMKRYWENHEEELKSNAYYKRKRKMLEENNGNRQAD